MRSCTRHETFEKWSVLPKFPDKRSGTGKAGENIDRRNTWSILKKGGAIVDPSFCLASDPDLHLGTTGVTKKGLFNEKSIALAVDMVVDCGHSILANVGLR